MKQNLRTDGEIQTEKQDLRDAEDGVRIMTSGFGRVNEVELMRAQTEQRNIKKRRGRNKLICGKKKKEYKKQGFIYVQK